MQILFLNSCQDQANGFIYTFGRLYLRTYVFIEGYPDTENKAMIEFIDDGANAKTFTETNPDPRPHSALNELRFRPEREGSLAIIVQEDDRSLRK